MIKLLATSDWHLGNVFHNQDRTLEFRHYLHDFLLKLIDEHRPDALLVAGDVFDTRNPSPDIQRLYYDYLCQLHDRYPALQIIVIAGNHDAPSRHTAKRKLLGLANVHLRALVEQDVKQGKPDYGDCVITVNGNESGERLNVVAVPYLHPGDYERIGTNYEKNVRNFIDNALAKAREVAPEAPIVLMAHLYATGSLLNKTYRGMAGGSQQVDVGNLNREIALGVFGHIHHPQTIGGRWNLRYVGSALPMSFSEVGSSHGAELYTFHGGRLTPDDIKRFEYEPLHSLAVIEADDGAPLPLKQIEKLIASLQAAPQVGKANSPYYKVVVKAEDCDDSTIRKLDTAFTNRNGILCVVQKGSATVSAGIRPEDNPAVDVSSIQNLINDPMSVLEKRYESVSGAQLNSTQRELLQQAIDEARVSLNNN